MPKPASFKVSLDTLTSEDKKVVKILERVGLLVHTIWLEQVDPKTGEAYFYPEGVTKEEIMAAAERDKEILSPYTVVMKDPDGKLYAQNYSEVHKKEITKICDLLEEAAGVTKSRRLRDYLKKLSRAYRKGDYQSALVAFLNNGNPMIDLLMGPIESYNDEFLGIKRSFQFSLLLMQMDETKEVDEMIKQMNRLSFLKPTGSVAQRLKSDRIQVRVDEVLMFAGRQASSMPSSVNLPNEPELLAKHGAKILVYNNSLYKKYDKQLRPYMSKVAYFDTDRARTAMKEANYRLIVLHEIAEGVIKFEGMERRSGEYIDVIRELNADLFGVMTAKYLVLNGLLSVDQYNELLVATVIFAVNLCHRIEKVPSLYVYAKGHAIMFNYMTRSGALTVSRGKLKFNFDQMSADIDALAYVVVSILREGTHVEAKKLLEEWGDEGVFEKLPTA